MARFKDFNRGEKDVGISSDGGNSLTQIFHVSGFEVKMDESVIWDMAVANPGPRPIRIALCKPFTFGPWEIVRWIEVPGGTETAAAYSWKPDNDSAFFFAEYQDSNGQWSLYDSREGHADGGVNGDLTAFRMNWFNPQPVQCMPVAR